MSIKLEAVRSLIGTAVSLGIVRLCQMLYEGVPILFMFCDIILKASEDRHVVCHGLAVGLRMIRRSHEVLNTEQCAERRKTFAGEHYIVICEEISRNAVQSHKVVKENIRHILRNCFGRRYHA